MSKTFSASDVAAHNKPDSLYITIDGDVYDLTKFQDEHPGGKKILQRVAGKDASKQFWKYHSEGVLKKYKPKLQVGSLDSKPKAAAPAPAAKPEPAPGTVAAKPAAAAKKAVSSHDDDSEALEAFGAQIPFSDPSWYQNVSSCPFILHQRRQKADPNFI
jgi:cytochrome b involved in lipid metabolism